jgi:hypothetical protein
VQLLANLKADETGLFKHFNHMLSSDFYFLLNKIEDKVSRVDTNYRDSIPPLVRLVLTLRFLATGDSYASLMYLFRISKRSILKIITEVCEVIEDTLQEHFGGNFFPSIIFL